MGLAVLFSECRAESPYRGDGSGRAEAQRPFTLDFAGRVLLATAFAVYFSLGILAFAGRLGEPANAAPSVVEIVGRVSSLTFIGLAVMLTVVRLPPRSESLGWMPRIAAILGTFMTLTLAILPAVDLAPWLELTGAVVTALGSILSVYCIWWLGRSFSIDAQARHLVTSGPYSIVRHPLYVSEAVGLIGLTISNLSSWSVGLFIANLAVQYWRVLNEERVLTSAFSEYSDYRATVPQLIPHLRRRAGGTAEWTGER
jgi:protein-S-isoprenylcysteine O-methyltransferase Ste14